MRHLGGIFLGLCLLLSPVAAQEKAEQQKQERAAQQKKTAQELWKSLLAKETPNTHETEHFLFIGTMDDKVMEKVGKAIEKHWPFVMKSLRFDEDEDHHLLWEGKLTVHLCKDRGEFRTLYTKFKRERPLDDEISTFHHEGVNSHLLIGPPSQGKSPLPIEVEVAGQLGAATLTRKRSARMPPWFVTGFARAHAYRFSPRSFSRERQLAFALLTQGKKTIGDVYNENDLAPGAVAVLRGSFLDFLAHSPQMATYWPKILGKIDEQTSLDQIWEQIRVKGEEVQQAWVGWARSPR